MPELAPLQAEAMSWNGAVCLCPWGIFTTCGWSSFCLSWQLTLVVHVCKFQVWCAHTGDIDFGSFKHSADACRWRSLVVMPVLAGTAMDFWHNDRSTREWYHATVELIVLFLQGGHLPLIIRPLPALKRLQDQGFLCFHADLVTTVSETIFVSVVDVNELPDRARKRRRLQSEHIGQLAPTYWLAQEQTSKELEEQDRERPRPHHLETHMVDSNVVRKSSEASSGGSWNRHRVHYAGIEETHAARAPGPALDIPSRLLGGRLKGLMRPFKGPYKE